MTYNLDGQGHGGGGPGPRPAPAPKGSQSFGGSPGLLTSTGGLFGTSGALLIPYMDTRNDVFFAAIIDSNNFDCEDDAHYFFRQEDIQDDRYITINRQTITYREIGKATFTFGIQVYVDTIDDYKNVETIITIKPKKGKLANKFPDKKLHTIKLDLVITGIRPQPYVKRMANSGPFSITKVRMIGDRPETEET